MEESQKLVVRQGTKKDYEKLRKIYFEARKNDFKWVDNAAIKMNDFDTAVKGELILVACLKEKIAGFVSIWEADNFIHNLFVDSEFRRYGAGKALLEEALKRSRKPMTLKCIKENENALKFYLSMGWGIVREGIGYEGPYYLISSKVNAQR